MTTVVYFHGFASGPQGPSPKTDLIRGLGHDVVRIATDGDYLVPDRKPIKFAKTTPPGRRQRGIRAHSAVN